MFKRRERKHDVIQTGDHCGASTEPRCAFCEKTSSDDVTLIAGPSVFICNECVDVCVDIIVQARHTSEVPPAGSTGIDRLVRESARTCGLCGSLALAGRVLPIENRGVLCGECADAVEDALSRGRPRS
jgi:ATP-dependent Clp protease ATP-binding subunit ClpX